MNTQSINNLTNKPKQAALRWFQDSLLLQLGNTDSVKCQTSVTVVPDVVVDERVRKGLKLDFKLFKQENSIAQPKKISYFASHFSSFFTV